MPSFRQIMRRVFLSDRNSLRVTPAITGIGSGKKLVGTAATRVTLVAASTPFKMVDIQALFTNTKKIAFGDVSVVALEGSEVGAFLTAGASVRIYGTDLVDIYLDAEQGGEGVSFTYYT